MNDYRVDILPDGTLEKTYRVVVHTFTMGDVDDVEIYAAEPIYKWQQTEAGKFVMANAIEPPEWHQAADFATMGHRIAIVARLSEKDYTWYKLKF